MDYKLHFDGYFTVTRHLYLFLWLFKNHWYRKIVTNFWYFLTSQELPCTNISKNFVISVIFELPQKQVQMSCNSDVPIKMKFVVHSWKVNNQFWNFDVFYVCFGFTKMFNYLYLSSLKGALNVTHKWNKPHFYKWI